MEVLWGKVLDLLKEPIGPTLWVVLMLLVVAGLGWLVLAVVQQFGKVTESSLKGQEEFPRAIGELRMALMEHSMAAKHLAEEVHATSRAVLANLTQTQRLHAENLKLQQARHEEVLAQLEQRRTRGAGE